MTEEQKEKAIKILSTSPRLDCFTLTTHYYKTYRERLDWHEFGYLLDHLHTTKVLEVIGYGREKETIYSVRTTT